MSDALHVEGVSRRVDGVYPCDIGDLLNPTSAESLTVDEWYYVQRTSAIRPNEAIEAFLAGDVRFRVALAVVVIGRAGKQIEVEEFGGKRPGVIRFEIVAAEEEKESPPTAEGETPSLNGGGSSSPTSDSQADDQNRTGSPDSVTPTPDPGSAQVTLVR